MDDGRGTPPPGDGSGTPPHGNGSGTPAPGDGSGTRLPPATAAGHLSPATAAAGRLPPATTVCLLLRKRFCLSSPRFPLVFRLLIIILFCSGDPPRQSPFPARKDGEPSASQGQASPTGQEDLPTLSLYCDTVFGPPMTRDEEVALKLHLEHILRQVQYSVKAMGLQPVELCDIDIVRPFPSRRGAITGAYPSLFKRSGSEVSRLPRRSLEAELEDTKMKNQELVAVFEQLSSQMKIKVATAMNNKHVTPEFAQDLDQLVECFNKNVQKAMQAGGGLLSMRGLLRMMNMYDKINTLRDNADTFGSLALCVVTIIAILNNDFTFAKLRLNCDPYRNVTRVSTDGASFLVKKSNASGMFSVKGAMHVDFSDPWRIKKLGVVCSFRL
ncbi:hypothetical protein ACQ4PT_025202 [Festuca glaucescens]